MKILTFWNVTGLGFGLIAVSLIVGTISGSGSAALAQSSASENISSNISSNFSAAIQQVLPKNGLPSAQSLSNLLRIGPRNYEVNYGDNVSTQILSSRVVRKIEFGKETFVSVVTTPSGVYSTDGLASVNVLYPGISVVETSAISQNGLLGFSELRENFGSSFTIQNNGTQSPFTLGKQSCISKTSFTYCSWQ